MEYSEYGYTQGDSANKFLRIASPRSIYDAWYKPKV